ncbi:unnamed protein product [Bursaphelenchus xylophilus]|uniref:Protein Wnt n=1 Tax=Bursaphelenchus xylophilus TaxID=6326 RepID=A0A1I7SM29_BURXY|nr:unnamed protein product [Bursaphelenchus xylophilus]CAG9129977.1 unnamed protein product [Bursaphelenchus xylophilus]
MRHRKSHASQWDGFRLQDPKTHLALKDLKKGDSVQIQMRLISFVSLFFSLELGLGIKWLALHKLDQPWISEYDCPSNKTERRHYGLVVHQSRMCKRFPELMPIITRAAQLSVDICQSIFGDARWNCTSVTLAPELKADLTKGKACFCGSVGRTKEQAFVYALSAASVTHQVAKACASGALKYCPCGYAETTMTAGTALPDAYKWKGCSDNVAYGRRISTDWADALWKHSSFKKRKVNEAEPTTAPSVQSILEFDEEHLNEDPEPEPAIQTKGGPRARMNQHNNNVGRTVTQKSLFRKCKCHGVSSGCEIQTCWYSLPPLENIAKSLKERYNFAQINHGPDPTGSKGDSRSTRVSMLIPELMFVKTSPTYCEEDIENGSFGTRGRECNVTIAGTGNCENLCCGRGFNTKQFTVEEQCKCKYVHCCYIKCKTCTSIVDRHFCK